MRRWVGWIVAVVVAPVGAWMGTMGFYIGCLLHDYVIVSDRRPASSLWQIWLGCWKEDFGGWLGFLWGTLLFCLYGFPISLMAAVVWGLPGVWFLKTIKKETWWSFTILGIVAGFLTALLMGIGFAWVDERRTFESFMKSDDAEGLFLLWTLCGAVSGWVFWRIAVRGNRQLEPSDTSPSESD